jgi:hypothetical protein
MADVGRPAPLRPIDTEEKPKMQEEGTQVSKGIYIVVA